MNPSARTQSFIWELSSKESMEYTKELDQLAGTPREAPPDVTFAVMLSTWYDLEYQREEIGLSYSRMAELIRRGRNVDKERIVHSYAQVKEELEIVEAQMVSLLRDHVREIKQIKGFLENRHFVPHRKVVFSVPDILRKRLTRELDIAFEEHLASDDAPKH